MALGASPESILRLLLSEQIRLLIIALAAGFSISVAAAQFLHAAIRRVRDRSVPVFECWRYCRSACDACSLCARPPRRPSESINGSSLRVADGTYHAVNPDRPDVLFRDSELFIAERFGGI